MNADILKETKIHGDAMFPFTVYDLSCNLENNYFDCHWHDELEFILITKGEAIFQVNAIDYTVHEGDVLFINSGEIHVGYPVDQTGYNFYAIVFHSDFINSSTYDSLQTKFIDPILNRHLQLPTHLKGTHHWEKDAAKHITQLAETYITKPYAYELSIKASLYLLLSQFIAKSFQSSSIEKLPSEYYKTERLKKVLQYIQLHYHEKITIKVLAGLVNMSEGYFCRFFKQMVRKTPVEYLNYYRITQAAKLLKDSDKKVFEIALDVGFENFSYFINTFKHYKHYTPSEYRKTSIQLMK